MNAAATRTMEELLSSRQQLNRASAEFLRIDLETGLTFAGIARQTHDDLRKSRNRLAARKAYETIMRLIKKVDLTVEDGVSMNRGLDQLKKELERLGERF